MKIDDAVHPVHACAESVSLTPATPDVERPFAHRVVFVPVRAAQPDPSGIACHVHPLHLPAAAPDEQLATIDVTLSHGGKRRDHVCGRCIGEAMRAADRDGPVVVWIVQPDAALDHPTPLTQPHPGPRIPAAGEQAHTRAGVSA